MQTNKKLSYNGIDISNLSDAASTLFIYSIGKIPTNSDIIDRLMSQLTDIDIIKLSELGIIYQK